MTDARINQWRWTARVLALLGLLAGVLAAASKLPAMVQDYAALAVALVGAGHYWIIGFLPVAPKRAPVLPVLLLLLAFGLMWSACNLTTGYRGVTVAVKVGNETGKTIAAVCADKRRACIDKHGGNVQDLQACVLPCHKALTAWTTIVRPAINTSTEAAFAALETARQAKRPDSTWVAKLRPGLCALAAILQEWRVLLGDKAAPLLSLLKTVEDVACSN